MNKALQKIQILLSQNRNVEAIKEIRKALAENPNSPFLLAILAEAQLANREFVEALISAKAAMAINAESSFLYLMLGKALYYNKQMIEAKAAFRTGLQLDAAEGDFYYWLGQVNFYEQNWELALHFSEQGLALDAEDVPLLNLRAQALIKLNRQADAQVTMDEALHRNPENSYSHANKGWSSLHSGDIDAANQQFREALRLDPTNDFAKEGLKEAIKGKNIVYRGVQKYFLWMNRMQSKYQWGFIIGVYVIYQIILRAMETFPSLVPFLMPLAIFYVIFAFSTWIARPISNLALCFHPLGKLALDDDEKLASNLVAGLGLILLLAIILHFTIATDEFYLLLAGFAGLSMIPVSGVFSVPAETKARKYLIAYTLFLLVCGFAPLLNSAWMGGFYVFAIGIFFYSFVTNYLIQLSSKEF